MTAATSMAPEEASLRVAIVGTGVIGASWAAHFLGRGARVIATDPAPGAADRLRADIDRIWPGLERMGIAPGASRDRLDFSADLEQCLAAADFVQENAPENLEGKQQLMQTIDAATAPGVIVASSSSGLLPTELQARCLRDPGRIVVGHPFHPPHLMPLVEVVGGRATGEATILKTLAFYRSVGKHPIHIRKELPGHVANRLQAALWREAFSLVEQGAATVADIDDAIRHGPGLRWAILGPFLTLHLTGGNAFRRNPLGSHALRGKRPTHPKLAGHNPLRGKIDGSRSPAQKLTGKSVVSRIGRDAPKGIRPIHSRLEIGIPGYVSCNGRATKLPEPINLKLRLRAGLIPGHIPSRIGQIPN